MQIRTRTLFIALLCAMTIVAGAFAQSVNVTTGAISGRITDSSGGALPGVTVTVTNTETGLSRNNVTETQGEYTVQLLPPGKYRVTAELAGLGTAQKTNVTVLLGNTTKVDLAISPQVSEQITVTAAAPVVDAQRSGTAVSVTQQQIESLPILGRDFRSLAQLTPGVSDAFGSRITANGARGLSTDYNIDGASSNNDFFGEQTGGTRAPFTFSQAAIREFQVVRSQYSAEYGRGVGAQVNAITRSGTNDLDGELFTYLRRREWAGTRPTFINGQTVQESFRAKDSLQPGFAIGGPAIKDKLFYFANGDFQRQKLPITPTDPRTLSAFTALDPAVQQAFIAKIEALVGHSFDEEAGTYDQTFNQNTYLLKLDANVGQKHHFSVRDNYSNFENANNQSFNLLSNQGVEHDKFNQLVGQGESVVTNSLFNQFIVQYSKDERPVVPNGPGPEVTVSMGTSTPAFGQNDFLPNNTVEKKIQFKDTVQYTLGSHTLKGGTDLLFMNIDNLFPRNLAGIYRYNSVQNFLANIPNTFVQGYGPGGGLTSWDQNTYAFFLTDGFRIGTKLTIDAGLRYDWQTMPKPATNAFPQHPEFVTNFKEDHNLAPRLGFAYDLMGTGRSVVRGGTGKFYGYMPDILLSNPLTQISGNFNQITLTCATATTVKCPAFPALLSPEQFAQLAKISTDIVTVGPNYQAQEAWRSSLQYEQQIGQTYSAAIGGIYNKMKNVQGSHNINATPLVVNGSQLMFGNLPIYQFSDPSRPYSDMGVVRELFSGETANYKSVTIETHKLAINNSKLSWDLSYTWSRSIDQDTNERSTSTSFLYDPFNPALSQGSSDNDIPHRVVADVTYRLPWGFTVSGIGNWRSGVPYTAGVQFRGTGTAANSLNGLSQMSGNIPVFVDGNGNVIDLLQASGMTRPQFAQFLSGQNAELAGRNTERQPNVWNVDARLAKSFNLTRGMQLEVLGEVFNVFNTKNKFVTTANQVAYTANYAATTDKLTFTKNANFALPNGYVSSVDPRQFQLGAKLRF